MSTFRMFVLIIVASFMLVERAQTFKDENIEIEQYAGMTWYQSGVLLPTSPEKGILCEKFTVKLDPNCTGCFEETYEPLMKKVRPRTSGFGSLAHSEMRVIYPEIGRLSYTFIITSYNNGSELILWEKHNVAHSKILSWGPIVSSEAALAFASLTRIGDLLPVLVNPRNCEQ